MIMNMCLINMCSKPSIAQVQYGKNKEDDKLPQLNLLLVFGEESGLPFYYRKLTGNIPDSKTVKHLFEDLDILGFGKTKFVMDRGFYSEENINGLYREHVKFLVGTKLSLKFIKNNLDDVYDDIRMFNNYDKDKRRIYIHYYYSIEKGADDEQAFDKRIAGLYRELFDDKLDVLECFEDANHSLRIGEMLNKQAEIYEALGVDVPTSSC